MKPLNYCRFIHCQREPDIGKSVFSHQQKSIAHAQQNLLHPRVTHHVVVEGHDGVIGFFFGFKHPAGPQGVVGGNQPAGLQAG